MSFALGNAANQKWRLLCFIQVITIYGADARIVS